MIREVAPADEGDSASASSAAQATQNAFAERMPGHALLHARLHRDTIARFGRFPWRNAALGRASTPAEQALLDAGGDGALVSGKVNLAEPC